MDFSETIKKNEDSEIAIKKNHMDLSSKSGAIISLCDNVSQQIFMLNAIKKERLQYIPFKVMLVEGEETSDYGYTDKIEIQAVWMSFGELDHIYYYKGLGTLMYADKDTIKKCNLERRPKIGLTSKNLVKAMVVDYKQKSYGDRRGLFINDDPSKLNRDYYFVEGGYSDTASDDYSIQDSMDEIVYDLNQDKDPDEIQDCSADKIGYRFIYEMNEKKQMVLNPRYYQRIIDTVKQHNLEKYIIDNVNKINFDFPQIQQSTEERFCNERIYGKYNVLIVTGFIFIELRKDDDFILNELPNILYQCLNLPKEVCDIMIAFLPIDNGDDQDK